MHRLLSLFGLLLVLALAAVPAHAKKKKGQLYDGPERPRQEVANLSLWNISKFLSKLQIYTVSIDETNFEEAGSIGIVPASGGVVQVLPGTHRLRVTFVEAGGGLLVPREAWTLPGWYEFEFEAKAGMFYAPIFRATEDEEAMADEMCLVELPFQDGRTGAALGKSRTTQDYLACVRPTADPRGDRKTWCRTWESPTPKSCPHQEPDGRTPVAAESAAE